MFFKAIFKIRDKETVKDICHDVFLSLWARREVITIDNMEAWLIQSVKYSIIKYQKESRKIKSGSVSNDLFITDNETDQKIIYKDLLVVGLRSIDKLFGKARVIFKLSKMQQMSNKEIASKMNLSEKSVEYYITKSLKVLRLDLKSLK